MVPRTLQLRKKLCKQVINESLLPKYSLPIRSFPGRCQLPMIQKLMTLYNASVVIIPGCLGSWSPQAWKGPQGKSHPQLSMLLQCIHGNSICFWCQMYGIRFAQCILLCNPVLLRMLYLKEKNLHCSPILQCPHNEQLSILEAAASVLQAWRGTVWPLACDKSAKLNHCAVWLLFTLKCVELWLINLQDFTNFESLQF